MDTSFQSRGPFQVRTLSKYDCDLPASSAGIPIAPCPPPSDLRRHAREIRRNARNAPTHCSRRSFVPQIRCGGQTDIGGGRENQDMWFSWADPALSGTHVLAVLDGHGREVSRWGGV